MNAKEGKLAHNGKRRERIKIKLINSYYRNDVILFNSRFILKSEQLIHNFCLNEGECISNKKFTKTEFSNIFCFVFFFVVSCTFYFSSIVSHSTMRLSFILFGAISNDGFHGHRKGGTGIDSILIALAVQ